MYTQPTPKMEMFYSIGQYSDFFSTYIGLKSDFNNHSGLMIKPPVFAYLLLEYKNDNDYSALNRTDFPILVKWTSSFPIKV